MVFRPGQTTRKLVVCKQVSYDQVHLLDDVTDSKESFWRVLQVSTQCALHFPLLMTGRGIGSILAKTLVKHSSAGLASPELATAAWGCWGLVGDVAGRSSTLPSERLELPQVLSPDHQAAQHVVLASEGKVATRETKWQPSGGRFLRLAQKPSRVNLSGSW